MNTFISQKPSPQVQLENADLPKLPAQARDPICLNSGCENSEASSGLAAPSLSKRIFVSGRYGRADGGLVFERANRFNSEPLGKYFKELCPTIEKILGKLKEREQAIIRLRYGLNEGRSPIPNDEVRKLLGVSIAFFYRLRNSADNKLVKHELELLEGLTVNRKFSQVLSEKLSSKMTEDEIATIKRVFGFLTNQEQAVFRLRYGLNDGRVALTYEEASAVLGIPPSSSYKIAWMASRKLPKELMESFQYLSINKNFDKVNEMKLSNQYSDEELRLIKDASLLLNKKEQAVLRLRYGLNEGTRTLSQVETGKILGRGYSFVSRVERKIYEKLQGTPIIDKLEQLRCENAFKEVNTRTLSNKFSEDEVRRINNSFKLLSTREQAILRLSYQLNADAKSMSQAEICSLLGISHSFCYKLIKSAHKKVPANLAEFLRNLVVDRNHAEINAKPFSNRFSQTEVDSLKRILELLSVRERAVIRLRYGLTEELPPLSQEKVGTVLNVSRRLVYLTERAIEEKLPKNLFEELKSITTEKGYFEIISENISEEFDRESIDTMEQSIAILDKREQAVFRLYYGLNIGRKPLLQAEIGLIFGVSQTSIGRILNVAQSKLSPVFLERVRDLTHDKLYAAVNAEKLKDIFFEKQRVDIQSAFSVLSKKEQSIVRLSYGLNKDRGPLSRGGVSAIVDLSTSSVFILLSIARYKLRESGNRDVIELLELVKKTQKPDCIDGDIKRHLSLNMPIRHGKRPIRQGKSADLNEIVSDERALQADQILLDDELKRQVRDAIDGLSPDLRRIVYLSFFDEEEPEQIAEELHISVEAVYEKTKRAIELLSKSEHIGYLKYI